MGKVGGFLVAAVILVALMFFNKSGDSADAKEQGVQIVELLDGFSQHGDYYMELFEEAHGLAFDKAYTMRGRRSAAEFDANAYKEALVQGMARQARADGESRIAEQITESGADIYFEEIPG